jgi:cobalt-zinc-cadmium efflux system outer membrane protein
MSAATLLVAVCWLGVSAPLAAQSCSGAIARENVARCALGASLALLYTRAQTEALEGRRIAVSPLLPTNPELTLSAARRSTAAQSGMNWYATLSQELEIAGQRSARRAQADAALHAQASALVATERDVAALAWRTYFDALAARDFSATAARLEQVFAQSSRATQAGAAQGLVSGIEAEVADLNTLRLAQQRIEAERASHSALAALSTLLGRDPAAQPLELQGELGPLAHAAALRLSDLDERIEQRAEVVRARQNLTVQQAARSTLERSRVPNVTLSLIAQRDGFGEQVLGGGIAVPVPLPYPLGRTLHGELSENAALTNQLQAELEQLRRNLRLELVDAYYAHAAAREQAVLYTPERVQQAQRSLEDLAQALQGGRVPISEAVIAQQTLVEFMRSQIRAKLDLCVSSIELARSAGLALWGTGL